MENRKLLNQPADIAHGCFALIEGNLVAEAINQMAERFALCGVPFQKT